MVEAYNVLTGQKAECTIDYPDTFNVRSLADEIALAQELALLNISLTFTKEIEKLIAMKALPKASEDVMNKIKKEIDSKTNDPAQGEYDFDKAGGSGKTPSNKDDEDDQA